MRYGSCPTRVSSVEGRCQFRLLLLSRAIGRIVWGDRFLYGKFSRDHRLQIKYCGETRRFYRRHQVKCLKRHSQSGLSHRKQTRRRFPLRCVSAGSEHSSLQPSTPSPPMFQLWSLSPSTSVRRSSSTVAKFATPATNAAPKWTPNSIRTGPIARKRGTTSMFLSQLENCQVTANIKTVRPDQTGYHAVQVAASDRPHKTATAQIRGYFRKAKVSPKRIVKEFPVTPDAHVPIGEDVHAHAIVVFNRQ